MVDQVKVIEIGADAIEEVLNDAPMQGLAYPPKLMHAVVAALGRHGFIIEDRYEEEAGPVPDVPIDFSWCSTLEDLVGNTVTPDWTTDVRGTTHD